MQKTTLVALLLAPLLVPVFRYLFLAPGRYLYRWLWVRLPEGRLRRFLLKPVGKHSQDSYPTFPKLPD